MDTCRGGQVLEWTQTMLAAGEAFCGSESATLRDALQRQSGRFFAAYHSANLQVPLHRTWCCGLKPPPCGMVSHAISLTPRTYTLAAHNDH